MLKIDSSKSNIDLAEKLGISEATVRRRINRLIELGLIRGYFAMINYEKIVGSFLKSYIYLNVDTIHLNKIVEKILSKEQLCTFYRCMGSEYNLMSGFVFRSIIDLQDFIDELRTHPGVQKIDFHIITGAYINCPFLGF